MKPLKNLEDVPFQEQCNFVNSFDHIMCDMDGVIWLHYQPIPGAVDCLDYLKKIGKKVTFVTNNSISSRDTIKSKLELNNFDATTEIVNPSFAIIKYLKAINFDRSLFVIASDGFKDELRKEGFSVLPDPPSFIKEDLSVFIKNTEDNPKVGAVIIDFDLNMTRLKLQKVLTYLKRADCLFIVGACDTEVPLGHGVGPLIGNKHVIQSIVEISGRECFQVSKPSSHFLEFLVDQLGIKHSKRVLVLGDSISSDMALAKAAGYQKLLVLSGATKPEEIINWKYDEDLKPDYYIKSLEELNIVLKNVNKN